MFSFPQIVYTFFQGNKHVDRSLLDNSNASFMGYVALHIRSIEQRLGHRNIKNALIYTHLITFEGDECHSAVAENVEEAIKLIEAGFEYVCEVDDARLFRKGK